MDVSYLDRIIHRRLLRTATSRGWEFWNLRVRRWDGVAVVLRIGGNESEKKIAYKVVYKGELGNVSGMRDMLRISDFPSFQVK